MNIGEAVRKRIKDLCENKGITINKLGTICGITQSTLSNIVNGRNQSVTLLTIKKICDGLELSVKDFFSDELFSDLDQEIK